MYISAMCTQIVHFGDTFNNTHESIFISKKVICPQTMSCKSSNSRIITLYKSIVEATLVRGRHDIGLGPEEKAV